MKLILGLGNPGEKYHDTRHNAGFLFLDFLREAWGLPSFESSNRFESLISQGTRDGEKIILVKPETYMNLSGKPADALLRYYKLEKKDLAVIHDDLDIERGKIRITNSSSCAGHNGVADIINRLGSQDFFRIRVGIGRPEDATPLQDYVLRSFTREEYALMHDTVFPDAQKALEKWMKNGN